MAVSSVGKFAWGVNFPNAANGSGVGTLNKSYSYQPARDYRETYALGARLFRIGFRTTRIMQSDAAANIGKWDQPLNASAVAAVQQSIKDALAVGPDATVIVDMHDYGRAFGVVYGNTPFDAPWIVKFWSAVLGDLKGNPRVLLDLNNEPHLSPIWQETITGLVPALRAAGISNTLVIEGNGYSAAKSWVSSNGSWFLGLLASDKNIIASPHLYLDSSGGGGANTCSASAVTWADDVLAWSTANKVQLLFGEFGYSTHSSCANVAPVVLRKMKAAGAWVTPWTYSIYMPTGGYAFGLARPASGAVEPSNLLKAFAAQAKE